MSQRNQHLTHAMLRKPATTTPKQFQTTWWQRWATCRRGWRPSISNRVSRDPAILLDLQKHCGLLKPRQFWQKRSLQQAHFRGRKAFWTPRSGPPQLRWKLDPSLIHLRHVKSFVSPAARKVPHCQKWHCHALPLFALDRAIPRLFSISILIAGETKNGRDKSTRWSVWQPCFWGCDMTLGTPRAASKVHQKQWNHKSQEGWHKHPFAELGRTSFGSPNSIYISNPKNGHQTNRTI